MERLATFNKYQIRFGWIRVIARQTKGRTVSPAELEQHITKLSVRQDDWLAGFAPPKGRASDRAVPDMVRMATTYGIYDRTAERLTWLGDALAELDRWDGRSSPMSWDLAIGLMGIRVILQTNGLLLFPLLRGWDDAVPLRDRVRSALETLATQGSSIAPGLLHRFANKDPVYPIDTVIRPLLEPLRELGLVEVEKDVKYRLTQVGVRFAEGLLGYSDVDNLLWRGISTEWLRANGRTPKRLSDREVVDFLRSYPPSLGGASETTAPEALVVAWLATTVLRTDPDAAVDSEDAHEALARQATARLIDLRPGTLAGEVEVDWTALVTNSEGRGNTEPLLQIDPQHVRAPGDMVLREGNTGAPLSEQDSVLNAAPTPGNHRRAWHSYVHSLLLSWTGAVHGGPRVWVWYLSEVLGSTTLPESVLDLRRKEAAFGGDVDTTKPVAEGRLAAIHAGGLAEIQFAVDANGRRLEEALPLFSLLERWSDRSANSTRVRAAVRNAAHEVSRLQVRLGKEVREWLGKPIIEPDDSLRILRFTRWLVEDALLRDGVDASELYKLLANESGESGGQSLLARLEGSRLSTYTLTQCFIVHGAPVTDEAVRSAVTEFECFKILNNDRLAFELMVECQSPAAARACGEHQRDKAVAWIEFRLAQFFGPNVALVPDDGEPELNIEGYLGGIEPQPLEDSAKVLGFEITLSQQPRKDSAIVRTLQLLRSSRIEPRPALKISHLWAAIEHLVSLGDTTKGPEVIRLVSTAGSWVLLKHETAETFRLMLAGLHTAAFDADRRAVALSFIDWVEGPEIRNEYEKYPESVVQSRQALFSSPRVVDCNDALVTMLRLSAVKVKKSKSPLNEISCFLMEVDPLIAWQLHRFVVGYSDRKAFGQTLRWVRRDLAGTLAWLYEVRNRVVHEGYTGDPGEDAFLLALYARARRLLDPIVAIVGAVGQDAAALSIYWGLFEELSSFVNGSENWQGIDDLWISYLGRLLSGSVRQSPSMTGTTPL